MKDELRKLASKIIREGYILSCSETEEEDLLDDNKVHIVTTRIIIHDGDYYRIRMRDGEVTEIWVDPDYPIRMKYSEKYRKEVQAKIDELYPNHK